MPPLASILDPLTGDFGATSAAELLLVGAACGAVGIWVVQFGRAILAESFTHALLPGLVGAALIGAGLMAGAVAGVLAAYALLTLVERAPKTTSPVATSVTVTLLVACGALLATAGNGIGSFESLLFGDPLAASGRDIAVACAAALVIAVVMYACHDRFTALAFDAPAAPALGVNVAAFGAAALALLVVAVSVAANVAGSLLALALVTGPAIGALALTDRIGRAIAVAAIAGAVSGIAGLYISFYADWPASASIALAVCAFAALASAGGSARRRQAA